MRSNFRHPPSAIQDSELWNRQKVFLKPIGVSIFIVLQENSTSNFTAGRGDQLYLHMCLLGLRLSINRSQMERRSRQRSFRWQRRLSSILVLQKYCDTHPAIHHDDHKHIRFWHNLHGNWLVATDILIYLIRSVQLRGRYL